MKNKDKLITVVETIARKEHKSPETVVSELNNMSEEQINNKLKTMNIFKKGGKLNYLICLKKGGSIKECGCGSEIKKGQDGMPDFSNAIVTERKINQTPNFSDTLIQAKLLDPSGLGQHQYIDVRGNDNGRTLNIRTQTSENGQMSSPQTYATNPSIVSRLLGTKVLPKDWQAALTNLLNASPKKLK